MFVVLGRLGWVPVVVVAMAPMTRGLVATVYFQSTDQALAAEARGERLVIVACVLLAAAALWCHRRMGPRPGSPA